MPKSSTLLSSILNPQQGGQNHDVDLYCNRFGESDFVPGPETAEWSSFGIGVNKDQLWVPPLDESELEAGELASC